MDYEISILAIKENKTEVAKVLMGTPFNLSKDKAKVLIQNGGIVYKGKNKLISTKILDKLKSLGVTAKLSLSNTSNKVQSKDGTFKISGKIVNSAKLPLEGLQIKLFHKAIGSLTLLSKTETDYNGEYSIEIDLDKTSIINKENINVIIKAYQNNIEKEEHIGISQMKKVTGKNEKIDLEISLKKNQTPSTYNILSAQLEKYNLDTLTTTATNNDVKLIAVETNLQGNLIRDFLRARLIGKSLSQQNEDEIEKISKLCFACIAGGVKPNLQAFLGLRDAKIKHLLAKAEESHNLQFENNEDLINLFRTRRVPHIVQNARVLSDYLKVRNVTQKSFETFLNSYLKSGLPGGIVVDELMKQGTLKDKEGKSLKDSLLLFEFAYSQPKLLNGIEKDFGIKLIKDLAKLTENQWLKSIKKYIELPNKSIPEDTYLKIASSISRSIEKTFSTEVFFQNLTKDNNLKIPLVQKWLNTNETFDFSKSSLEEYWRANEIKVAPKEKELLEKTERLFHLAPVNQRYNSFKALWLGNYENADSVLQGGRGKFNVNMKSQGLNLEEAANIYKNAQHQQSVGLFGLSLAKVNTEKETPSTNSPVKIEPTLAALFGDKGSSGCEHCISAFSPSAYLIDMLRFLERANTSPNLQGKTGLQLLFERRPDINNLRLDCENSHTPLPFIDLVNELLEHVVATSSLVFKIPDAWLIESSLALQTTWTTEELAAHPEYLQVEAYNKLRLTTAPWGLPYNLWADEVRTYLKQLGTDRTELMALLRPDNNPLKLLEVAAERLGLDAAEVLIVINPASNTAKRTLIWQTGNPAVDLKNIRKFIKRTSLNFDKITEVFSSNFVNPNARTLIPEDLSDLDSAEFQFISADNSSLLDRFHRFVRIINKTNWHVGELDAALQNISKSAKLDIETFSNLGIVAEMNQKFNIPIDEIASWFGNLYSTNFKNKQSIYHKNFALNSINSTPTENGLNLIEDVFGIKGNGITAEMTVVDLVDQNNRWLAKYSTDGIGNKVWELHPDIAMSVMAGCNINSDELLAIISSEMLPELNDEILLNIANLSEIFRQASMARALHISVAEILKWQKLIGYPLGPSRTQMPGPIGTLFYLLLIDLHISGGITADLLLYTIQGISDEDAGLELTEEDLDELISKIKDQIIVEQSTYNQENTTGIIEIEGIVYQILQENLGLDEGQVEELIKARPANMLEITELLVSSEFLNDESNAQESVEEALLLLFKQASLIQAIHLNAEEIAFTQDFHAELNLLDFSTLGNANLLKWYNLFLLKQIQTEINSDTDDIYAVLAAVINNEIDEEGIHERMSNLFGINMSDFSVLVSTNVLNMIYPSGYLNMSLLHRLKKACNHLKHLGIEGNQLLKLAEPITSIDAANITKTAVRKHYEQASWLQVSEKLRGEIRERQRDALVNFVRTRGALDLTNEQTYAFYLIDVDMGSCFTTSRTKQAIASVQQFIQRILLGLEFDPQNGKVLSFFKEDAAEWKWRKNYRVWEANVKVFAYPENWLEPDLRDNKTPIFKEFEQELMQGELNHELAENAVLGYLDKLHEISNLEIVNFYDLPFKEEVLVVARTSNFPHKYYLRKWLNKEVWTPWTKIDAEIESEQVLLGVYSGELYLCWPSFNEQLDEEGYESSTIHEEISLLEDEIVKIDDDIDALNGKIEDYDDLVDNTLIGTYVSSMIEDFEVKIQELERDKANVDLQLAEKRREQEAIKQKFTYQEIELNWMTQRNEAWSGKQLSKGFLLGEKDVTAFEYRFTVSANSIRLKINVYASEVSYHSVSDFPQRREDQLIGYFILDNCTGEMRAAQSLGTQTDQWEFFDNSAQINTHHHIKLVEEYTDNNLPFGLHDGNLLLEEIPSNVLAGITDCKEGSENECFFIADKHRTFFFRESITSLETNSLQDLKHLQELVLEQEHIQKETHYQKRSIPTKKREAKEVQPGLLDEFEIGKDININELNFPEASFPIGKVNVKYEVSEHYHAYACAFTRQVRRFGIEGLYDPDPNIQGTRDANDLVRQKTDTQPVFNFDTTYKPNRQIVVGEPREVIDFSYGSAYEQYNWEIFFHIPMMIATRLTQNQKFDEAQKWFHFIFDPTSKDGIGMERYWKIKPFYFAQLWGASYEDLEEQLERVDDTEGMNLETMINEWEANPFQPYAISRFRIVAFMRMTVMKYLDNLIAWGDRLFRQDTMESINEATQLYILASNILGEPPLIVDNKNKANFKTVSELLNGQFSLAALGNSLNQHNSDSSLNGAQGILGVLGQFCLPFNDYILDYWDIVGDRLFKIRNCLNIDGVFRKLPLFQPPIDPALLVNAAASGVDIASVTGSLLAPLPHYRFNVVFQKSIELIENTKYLGNQLLGIMEKKDAETLSLMKAEQEKEMLSLSVKLKKEAIKELKNQKDSLEQNKKTVEIRVHFYKNRQYMNIGENLDLTLRTYSWYLRTLSQITEASSVPLSFIPRITAGVAGIASPVTLSTFLEPQTPVKTGAKVLSIFADFTQTAAGMAQTMGQYGRRKEEWDHQTEVAESEIKQIEKQLAGIDIKIAMAEHELSNHERRIELAEESTAFLKDKFTNETLYNWMLSQMSSVYFQTYQLAFEMAKRAEMCYKHELGIDQVSFVKFGYWDSLKKGLLAGEKLLLDARRMEVSYMENNIREYEISKNISLALLDPLAILNLRLTGSCEFEVPEILFDMDYPGHFFRRIKSVSISIPCVTGPFTSINAKLTMLNNKYRKEVDLSSQYEENINNDERFVYEVDAIKAIAVSQAQQDSGVFDLNFRDERYLPFERAGAISRWRLELATEIKQFNYETITDVVVGLNYTAREGGEPLKSAANTGLTQRLEFIQQDLGFTGLFLLIDVRKDLPNLWHLLINKQNAKATVEKRRLPYLTQSFNNLSIESVTILVKTKDGQSSFSLNVDQNPVPLALASDLPMLQGQYTDIDFDTPFSLSISQADSENLADLMLLVNYKL
ncbi:neuraminidase-like domain-containing protein [Flexithrix dorotheae]|uniref:Tc toxin subunit A-related protein n=1 Tax=Flexithrix dorotheae TaxID=70993 RepID=UPI000381B331|nr:neuraminidase-like domain-containing protein [Flexithrix dorotheae]